LAKWYKLDEIPELEVSKPSGSDRSFNQVEVCLEVFDGTSKFSFDFSSTHQPKTKLHAQPCPNLPQKTP
jgi:hypothetical protein